MASESATWSARAMYSLRHKPPPIYNTIDCSVHPWYNYIVAIINNVMWVSEIINYCIIMHNYVIVLEQVSIGYTTLLSAFCIRHVGFQMSPYRLLPHLY